MRNRSRLGLLTGIAFVTSLTSMGCSSAAEEQVATSTSKVTAARFCPRDLIPRRDMARFLMRLKRGRDFVPPAPRGQFSDVPDPADQGWIEALYDEGITRGCGENLFCPNDPVPREQMAGFIVRLFHGRDFDRPKTDRFTDVVDGHEIFEGYIEQLAEDGITKGCTETQFCPSDMVPREQMAAFLMRAAHRGSADEKRATRFEDVPAENIFSGRIEQAVEEGIMEPCGAGVDPPTDPEPGIPGGGWDGPILGTVGGPGGMKGLATTGVVGHGLQQRFNFFAKSSIDTVREDEKPPRGSRWGADQSMGLLTWGTNQSYQEHPSNDWWGASYNSGGHRLWVYLGIETQCAGPLVADRPWLSYKYSDAGSELGVFAGTHNLDTRIVPEGDGYGVRYVVWGHPDGKLEPTFQAIKSRANKDIFQFGTIHITCGWDSVPRATMDTYEGPSFGGSAFPSHHAWVFAEGDNYTHEKQYIRQAYSNHPDGPGMKNLWFLPPVPPPGALP